jgi:putative lipoic acid-binding regulatory protein
MKSIRQLVVVLVVVMIAALLVAPTFAQDNPSTPTAPTTNSNVPHRPSATGNTTQVTTRTITITQEQINTRLANRPGDRLKDLSIVLGNNQITVSFTTNGEKNNGVGRKIVGVATPAAVDGKVKWTLNSLTIDGTAATQEQMDKLKERVTDLIGGKFGQRERRFSVTSVTVDSSAISITLTRNKSV